MNNQPANTSSVQPDAKRLPYASPSLKVYGQLRDLTDGGSGGVTEGMAMTNLMRKV